MKQATVAGITVALGPVLQGCGGDENDPTDCGTISSPDTCINNRGECHWDIETIEEDCILQDDFDDALFTLTAPDSLQADDIASSQLTFDGCSAYDAVVAQRCTSKCELDLTYRLAEKSLADESGSQDISYSGLESQFDYFEGEEVVFYLPTVADNATLEGLNLSEATFQDVYEAVNPDWTPFGELSDHRLQVRAQFSNSKVTIRSASGDMRFVADDATTDDNYFVALRQDITLNNDTWDDIVSKAGGETLDELEAYFKTIFSPEQAPADPALDEFALGVLARFQALHKLACNAEDDSLGNGQPAARVSVVQADLESNAFASKAPFDDCNIDRNCGYNFATGQCAELQKFCAQFETSEACPSHDYSAKLSMPQATNGPEGEEAPEPTLLDGYLFEGEQGNRVFEGYVQYVDDFTQKCAFREGECGLPDEFVTCSAAGFPTQNSEDNICIIYDLVPQQWARPEFDENGELLNENDLYDVDDLTTFAKIFEIVGDDIIASNPRGCMNANAKEIAGMTYLGGAFGFEGPVCTYPEGWDCTVNDDPDTEPGCDVTESSICFYQEGSNGQCVSNSDFYAKYFDSATNTPLYESTTVVFPEIGEEDLDDAAEEEGSEDGDEAEEEEMPADRIA